jgi:hypothetical protein
MNGLREHITKELLGFQGGAPSGGQRSPLVQAKSALAKHVGKLVLTPAVRDGRPLVQADGQYYCPGGWARKVLQTVGGQGRNRFFQCY